jgi:hypothetical protein
MSMLGKKVWLYMQEHEPPYTRRSLARKWKKDGTYNISSQSISNYLRDDHPSPEFINAIVEEFRLTPFEEMELHWLYFHPEWRDLRPLDTIFPEIAEKQRRWAAQHRDELAAGGSLANRKFETHPTFGSMSLEQKAEWLRRDYEARGEKIPEELLRDLAAADREVQRREISEGYTSDPTSR